MFIIEKLYRTNLYSRTKGSDILPSNELGFTQKSVRIKSVAI